MSIEWSRLTEADHGRLRKMIFALGVGWILVGASVLVLQLTAESSGSAPGAVFLLVLGLLVLLTASLRGRARWQRRRR